MLNLEKISKKALIFLTVLHWIVYAGLVIVAPCITIMVKYNMIGEKVSTISGIGISVLVVFAFIGLGLLKKEANKIAIDSYIYKARCKAFLNLIFSVLAPIICLILIMLIKDNMDLATSCIKICVWFVIGGFVENAVLGSSVERENMIRDGAKRDQEKAKRASKV